MTEEEKRIDVPTDEKATNPADAYVENVKKMKEGMVSREEYDRILAQNKTLADAVAFGVEEKEKPAEVVDTPAEIEKLRSELYGHDCANLSNLDFWVKTLQLRKDIMDSGKEDPFVANGKNITGTAEDYAAAQRVADVVQECIVEADGDSNVFTALLQQRTKDVRPR